jgi:hypothetical protein
MTIKSSFLAIHHDAKALKLPTALRKRHVLLRLYANLLMGALGHRKSVFSVEVIGNSSAAAYAFQTVTFASSSGTVGVVVNGVAGLTVTWGTSDVASMTALVAAFNASTNALIQYLAMMTNTRAQVTLASVLAGQWFSIGQYRFVAKSGTVNAQPGEFDISGNDTADAAALCAAINTHPEASKYFVASNAAGVVSIWRLATPATGGSLIYGSASTFGSLVQFAAAAVGVVVALKKGIPGNCQTIAATGTNVSVGAARLTGGAGGDATQYAEVP